MGACPPPAVTSVVTGVTAVLSVGVTLAVLALLPANPTDTPTVTPAPLVGQPGRLELLQAPRGDKPAAHVVASASPSGGSLRWDSSVAPALMRNGVQLQENRLVVPRDGLYFVYAAAAFQGGPCPPRAPPGPPLRLWVSRFSQEYPRDVPLLSAARSVCRGGRRRHRGVSRDQSERGVWFESLYQGAVFQLRRGDQLAATATAGRFLDLHGGGGAYFGVVGVD